MAGNYDFGQVYNVKNNNTTDVNVVGMADKALSGIIAAIDRQSAAMKAVNDSINQTNNAIDSLEDVTERQNDADRRSRNSELTRSVASERRTRAAEAALHSKVDKGFSLINTLTSTLKDTLSKILSLMGDMAKQSLRSYDENTREMRKQFLTTEQIKKNLVLGDKAKEALSEMSIKVNSDETKSIVTALAAAGADTSSLSEKQIAAITMMNKTMGTDVKTALTLVKTSKDPEEIIKMAVQASDVVGRETTAKLVESINEDWFALYAQQAGGTEKAISQLQSAAKDLDAALGDYLGDPSKQKDLIAGVAKISSGQLDKVKQDEIINALAISADAMHSPEKLIAGIQNMITRSDMTVAKKLEKLNILRSVDGISSEFIIAMENAVRAQGVGEYKARTQRRADENLEAINQAQRGGKLGGFIDSIMTGINTATSGLFEGGVFGSLSAELNEMFGSNVGVEQVVSSGFNLVVKLLTGIAATLATSAIISKGFGLLSKGSGLLKGLASSVTAAGGASGILGKIATGIAGLAPALLPLVAIASVVGAGTAFARWALNRDAEKDDAKTAEEKAKKAEARARVAEIDYENILRDRGENDPITQQAKQNLENLRKEATLAKAQSKKASWIADKNDSDAATFMSELESGESLKTIKDILDQINTLEDAKSRGISKEGDAEKLEMLRTDLEHQFAILNQMYNYTERINSGDISYDETSKFIKDKDLRSVGLLPQVIEAAKISGKIRNTDMSYLNKYNLAENKELYEQQQKLNEQNLDNLGTFVFKRGGAGLFTTGGTVKEASTYNTEFTGSKIDRLTKAIEDLSALQETSLKNTPFMLKTANRLNSSLNELIAETSDGEDLRVLTDLRDRLNRIMPMAEGGVVTKATPALVGEAGKEAVIPLEKPGNMRRVLGELSSREKLSLLRALLSNKSTGNISIYDALQQILVNKKQSEKPGNMRRVLGELSSNLSNKIIEGAAAQRGHSYTEMVCNQLVEAALKYAGFKPPTTGVVTKHFNHPNMHLVLNDPINGISPTDPRLLPGMIMFSHPFTQAEADQLNRQKGGKRKAGDPGHMGIYAGNGLWWNSTSSKRFKDYSSGVGIDSTASGVALTKPFTKGTYKLYAAGYYDGMFDRSDVSGIPLADKSKQLLDSKTAIKNAGLLSDSELNEIAKEAGIQNAATMSEFVKQAEILLNSNSNKDSIVEILLDIAKYLRGAVSSKSPLMSVNRPAAKVF